MKRPPSALLAVAFLAAGFGLRAEGADERNAETEGKTTMFKAVIHIDFSDTERQKHGLKNVANILKQMNGDFQIEVVCHGGGIGLLVKEQSQHNAEVNRLQERGIVFAACENTMKEKSISKGQLLPGVVTVPSGAVEIIRRQQEGFGYFKP